MKRLRKPSDILLSADVAEELDISTAHAARWMSENGGQKWGNRWIIRRELVEVEKIRRGLGGQIDLDDYIDLDEFAKRAGVSAETARRMIQRPGVKVNGRWYIEKMKAREIINVHKRSQRKSKQAKARSAGTANSAESTMSPERRAHLLRERKAKIEAYRQRISGKKVG